MPRHVRPHRRLFVPFCAIGVLLFSATQSLAAAPIVPHSTPAERLQSFFGLLVFVAFTALVGRLRGAKTFPWRVVIWGLILQFACAFLVIAKPTLLELVQNAVDALLGFTREGASVVFGDLANTTGADVKDAAGNVIGHAGNVGYFAFFVLPTIIFFAALTAVAYHSGVMQYIVQGLAWVMSKTTGASGAETLSTAANIFVGQTEAPLMVKPFVATATNSELMVIMVGGFANIASGVLGLYTAWLRDFIHLAGGHLAAACFISAPATLVVGKLLMPETSTPDTASGVRFKVERIDANLVDAAARGTSEGLGLALNVAAMLIAFTALVALVNALLAVMHLPTMQYMLGYVFRPFAWLTGISWADSKPVGSLLGVKTVLNELIAYSDMRAQFLQNPNFISPRSALLALYALCGFANFASVGIQVGGISTLAPARRHDLSRIGLLAMFGGAIASLMGACVIGVLI